MQKAIRASSQALKPGLHKDLLVLLGERHQRGESVSVMRRITTEFPGRPRPLHHMFRSTASLVTSSAEEVGSSPDHHSHT